MRFWDHRVCCFDFCIVTTSFSGDGFSKRKRDWFLLALLSAELLLILSTWPLWFCRSDFFPVVPFWGWLAVVPVAVDTVFAVVLLAAVLLIFADQVRYSGCRPVLLIVTCVTAVVLAVLNQHRMQPWHWLFVLLTSQMILVNEYHQRLLRRITLASIYIFAGLSRFGSAVDTGAGRQLLTVICEKLNLVHLLRDDSTMFLLCTLMTALELTVGIGLLISGTRVPAVIGAMTMHLLLLVALGPWGLNHHTGVLIWNTFFLFALPLLFLRRKRPGFDDTDGALSAGSRTAVAYGVFLILFPLFGLFGVMDSWPSWQLYSPRPDVVRLFVKESDVPLLPKTVQQFADPPAPLDDWCPVRIDRWSLAFTNAPLYPECRFQLAIVQQICAETGLRDVRVTLESASFLYWQTRQWSELFGTDAIRQKANEYRLNGVTVRR